MTPFPLIAALVLGSGAVLLGGALRRGASTAMEKEQVGDIHNEEQSWEPLWRYPWESRP